jgi:hypothetical protein
MTLDAREKITSFWCGVCKARIPCRSRNWRTRRRQHAALHQALAAKRAGALADETPTLFDAERDIETVPT